MDFESIALIGAWVVIVILAAAMAGIVAAIQAIHGGTAGSTNTRGKPDRLPASVLTAAGLDNDGADSLRILFVKEGCVACGEALDEFSRAAEGDTHETTYWVATSSGDAYVQAEKYTPLQWVSNGPLLFDYLDVATTPFYAEIDAFDQVRILAPWKADILYRSK